MRTEFLRFVEALEGACKAAGIPSVPITHVQEEFGQLNVVEEGGTFDYPHVIHFNAEAWSTFKYSLRLVDGRFIREGTSLSGEGITQAELIQRIVESKQAHVEFCRAHEAAHKQAAERGMHALRVGGNEYVLIDEATHKALGPKDGVLFKVIREDGSGSSAWIVWDAAEAITQELTYYRRNPSPITGVIAVPDVDDCWGLKRGTK